MKALEILKRTLKTPQDLFRYSDLELETSIKEIEEFNNRSCNSCKHWSDSCINLSINTTGFCMYYGICNGDFEEDMKNSFCCNRYEPKENK